MYYTTYLSPMGEIVLVANDDGLTALAFQAGKAAIEKQAQWQEEPSKFLEVVKQLEEYFTGTRVEFDIPLAPTGTPFQKSVWQALCNIKQGETFTYSDIATAINNPKAVRAVGTANGANPIALIVPCHRVIGSNGKLTGYAGGLGLKSKLLMHEGAHFKV